MKPLTHLWILLAVGCSTGVVGAPDIQQPDEGFIMPEPTRGERVQEGGAAAGPDNTFDHPASLSDGATVTVREALARLEDQGPPAYAARVHGCRKIRYATLGRVLSSLGVDLASDATDSAGLLYRQAEYALGAPNYAARAPETTQLTSAGASLKLFDIFVQASGEVRDRLPTAPACGSESAPGPALFAADGRCQAGGLSCLLGRSATADHVAFCDDLVERAPSVDEGQRIAIAAMLSATYACE